MVYLHFPSNLTEEELMLQAKYQKLKKKKKALQALKAPKQEPEKPMPKRPTEARDAREIARKLLRSGAIQAIKSPPPLPQNATFKRPRAGRERKLSGSTGALGGVASYQPFSASQEPPVDDKPTPRVKHLYDSFVTARDKDDKGQVHPPSRGSTLYITCPKLPEELLKKKLAAYEPLLNVNCDSEKHKAFVTFDTPESAAKALAELEGATLEDKGPPLRVSYARRQPSQRPPSNDGQAQNSTWTQGQKTSQAQKDAKRNMVTYDDIFE